MDRIVTVLFLHHLDVFRSSRLVGGRCMNVLGDTGEREPGSSRVTKEALLLPQYWVDSASYHDRNNTWRRGTLELSHRSRTVDHRT